MLSSLFSENNESLTLAYPETHCFSEISGTSSVHSSDSSFVEISSQCLNRNLTITDLFPDVHILPNSLLVDDENELYSQQHQTLVSNVVFLLPNVLKTSITFSSLLCCNWLLNFSTVSSTDEAEVIMSELLKLGWIKFLDSKHSHLHCVESSKTLTLKLTDIGVKVAKDVSLSQYIAMKSAMFSCKSSLNMSTSDIALSISETNSRILEKEPQETFTPPLTPTFSIIESKESNAFKLKMVLKSPVLRPLFRNFLMANFCQENLDFWIDYDNLRRRCQNHALIPTANQRQLLEDAYILWNSYLRPGAVCELNIEHALREDMAEEMSHIVTVIHEPLNNTPRVVVSTYSTYQSLSILIKWFDKINEQICKLMSTDSIPKFVTTSKYKNALKSIQSFPVLPE
ncbi:RGS domain-containing protein [Sporodiniella umbellata]|nr:RGS domain-containing protein [Sporodiniella umbellata]